MPKFYILDTQEVCSSSLHGPAIARTDSEDLRKRSQARKPIWVQNRGRRVAERFSQSGPIHAAAPAPANQRKRCLWPPCLVGFKRSSSIILFVQKLAGTSALPQSGHRSSGPPA